MIYDEIIFRLFVSGLVVFFVFVLNKWREIFGYILLERYGMIEIGMVFINLYKG